MRPIDPRTSAWLKDVASSAGLEAPGRSPEWLGPDRSRASDHADVLKYGSLVVKLHPLSLDPAGLQARLSAVCDSALASIWVQPLVATLLRAPGGRPATLWPLARTLDPRTQAPWRRLGMLLARLHNAPVPNFADRPPIRHGGLARLQRAAAGARELGTDLRWLAATGECLVQRLGRPEPSIWVHGDFHLGQVARKPAARDWLLLDIDDLGLGDPAWDLARPAGFWAVGLIGDDAWSAFLDGYREAKGPAVPPSGDPWPTLDLAARAAVFVAAYRGLRSTSSDPATEALLAGCRRMKEWSS